MNDVANEQREWDFSLMGKGASFLQSWEWKELQENIGRSAHPFRSVNGQSLFIEYKLPFGKNYIYSPRGPVAKEKNFSRQFFSEIKEAVSKSRPVFLRVEPQLENNLEAKEALSRLNFRNTAPAQPDQTLLLDLTQNEESLIKRMQYETRYAIRLAQKRGVRAKILKTEEEKSAGFEKFWNIFKETNKRHGLRFYSRDYYYRVALLGGDCHSEMILAELDGNVIGAAIIVFFGKIATYLFAASSAGYGRFNAPSLIVWASILRAKEKRCAVFDFWGISEKNKAWQRITAFKKSFGGKETDYVGTWDIVFVPFWYRLYKLFKK